MSLILLCLLSSVSVIFAQFVGENSTFGIESATAEWSNVSSQLRLNCTLSPVDPAIGCLFIMLRHNSNETIESILVLPEISGCTVSDLNISCCDIECSVTSLARYVVYPVYEKGVVQDTIVAIEGNVNLNNDYLCTTDADDILHTVIYKLSDAHVAGIGVGTSTVSSILGIVSVIIKALYDLKKKKRGTIKLTKTKCEKKSTTLDTDGQGTKHKVTTNTKF